MIGETIRKDPCECRYQRQPSHRLPRHKPWIDPTAKLLPGAFIWGDVTVGAYAVIMPNSVLYCDAPPRAVMRGNPARLIDLACDCGGLLGIEQYVNLVTEMPSGNKRLVPLKPDAIAICPECQRGYRVGEICAEVVISE